MTLALEESSPSSEVSCRTYTPGALKVTEVTSEEALAMLAVPGPLARDHVWVSAPGGSGRPSSEAVPESVVPVGRMMGIPISR